MKMAKQPIRRSWSAAGPWPRTGGGSGHRPRWAGPGGGLGPAGGILGLPAAMAARRLAGAGTGAGRAGSRGRCRDRFGACRAASLARTRNFHYDQV